ncbi:MAG: hypothetical protein R3F17_05905 [Planctomycetota bacterium]
MVSGEGPPRVVSLAENGLGRNRRHPEGRGTLWRLRPLTPGEVPMQLAIEADGFYRYELPLDDWLGGKSKDLGAVAMTPVAELSFEVQRAAQGSPLREALITLREMEGPVADMVEPDGSVTFLRNGDEVDRTPRSVSVRADAEGKAKLTPISAPRLELKVSAALHADFYQRDFHLPDGARTYRIELPRGARAGVRIVDADGDYWSHAWLLVEPPSDHAERGPYWTDDNGWTVLPKAWPGTWRMRALPDALPVLGLDFGRPWDPWQGYDVAWQEVILAPGGDHEVELRLPPLAVVAGHVTHGGEPVEGASLFLSPYPASVESELLHAMLESAGSGHPWLGTTDEDGEFYLERIPAGMRHMQVRLPGNKRSFHAQLQVESDVDDWAIDVPADWQPRPLELPEAMPEDAGVGEDVLGGVWG